MLKWRCGRIGTGLPEDNLAAKFVILSFTQIICMTLSPPDVVVLCTFRRTLG